jgi:hypothetical protein
MTDNSNTPGAGQQGSPAPQVPATPAIQFERAEFGVPAGAAAPAIFCHACKSPVGEAYYAFGQNIVCARCRDGLMAALASGSRLGRLLRATAFGVLAACAGTLIWFAIRKATGYEIGLVAIVVGLMVGTAVRKGSGGRGGIGYQLLAVFLTYSSIVANYVPDVYQALSESFEEHRVERNSAATQPSAGEGATATTQSAAAAGDEGGAGPSPMLTHAGPVTKFFLPLLFLLILFAIAFVAPVLVGVRNVIGLLIIGFALWEAWKINRARRLVFTGPHRVGASPGDAMSATTGTGPAA